MKNTNKIIEEIEKEFDNYIEEEHLSIGHETAGKGSPVFINNELEIPRLKSFLKASNLRVQESVVAEIIEKIEGMGKGLPPSIDLERDAIGAVNAIRNQGFNQAIDQVIKEIKK